MSIIARTDTNTGPKPPEGQHAAVCCDVLDLGMMDTTFEGRVTKKHKIDVLFLLDKLDEDGKPFIANRRFTLTMDVRGNLRPFLGTWRGKPYTEAQALMGIDVEKMVGVPAYISIQNNERGYPRIVSCMGLPDGLIAPALGAYVRFKDRDTEQTIGEPTPESYREQPAALQQDDDDDLPF